MHYCLIFRISDAEFNLKYSLLPPEMKQLAMDLIDFLKFKHVKAQVDPPKKKREFGSLKGEMYMAPDFDEPLEDFKEYM